MFYGVVRKNSQKAAIYGVPAFGKTKKTSRFTLSALPAELKMLCVYGEHAPGRAQNVVFYGEPAPGQAQNGLVGWVAGGLAGWVGWLGWLAGWCLVG